ncbi:MAG: polyether ionophore transport system permease protein [Chloroflexota bacterium]|jgi:ABC-2 type transport system permease protein|nr:polyether ionophore transport system permease protein [Chloroflexota bacterium]
MIRWMAWRLHRRGLLGFTVGGFVISFLYGAAFTQAAGNTAASQAAFGRSVILVAKQFAFLIPIPVHPETLGGYEQYKWLASAIVMMSIWAVLAGVGVGRGDEERGLTAEWLVSGVSRTRLLLARSAAFGLVLLVACVGSVLGIVAVAPVVHQDPNFVGEMGKALSMAAGFFACYALALLVSQLPPERQTATALSVGALVLLLVLNGIADTIDSVSWIGLVSPFHWMETTSSAAPGGRFDTAGTVGLAAVAVLCVALAVAAFQRRDIGSGLFRWGARARTTVRVASSNVMLRFPFSEGLWEQRVGLGVWAVGTLVLGALMVSVTKSMVDALSTDPALAALFQRVTPGPAYASMLALTWFGTALLLLAGYAVVQVSRWSTQDQEGRVEMLLTAPISRSRVVLERALEFAAASLVIVLSGYIGVASEAPGSGLNLDPGHLFTASALLWPFALAFGGLGVAVASRWPRIAVPFLGGFAFVSYVLGDLGPLFKFPDWAQNLSVFHLYGSPLTQPGSWTAALSMSLIFVVGFGLALVLMRSRDVSSA